MLIPIEYSFPYWLFFLEQPFFIPFSYCQLNNETIEFPTVYTSNTPVKSIIG
jgi:hypothetical protein